MPSLRNAVLEDVAEMVELGRAMHNESPRFQGADYDTDKVFDLVSGMIEGPNGFVAVVESPVMIDSSEQVNKHSIEKKQIIGLMLGFVAEDYFGKSLTACDLALYVIPSHRCGFTAVRLVKAYQEWAKEKGARLTQLGISTGVNPGETKDLYNKLGFQDAGFLTLKVN